MSKRFRPKYNSGIKSDGVELIEDIGLYRTNAMSGMHRGPA